MFAHLLTAMPRKSDEPISPQQCVAARAFLDWTQQQLADAAGISAVTVRMFEGARSAEWAAARKYKTGHTVKVAIAVALEEAGIEFIPENGGGPGVRLRRT